MADITVHKGYREINGERVPVAWVKTSVKLEPEVDNLIDALGSKYLRYAVTNDEALPEDRPEELPESLTQRQILEIYREEVVHWGEGPLATWGDGLDYEGAQHQRKWLTELLVTAFPEMKECVR